MISCLAFPLTAREGDWALKIGVSYRELGDIDMKSYDFTNPLLGTSEYVNGAANYLDIQDNTLILDNSLNVQNDGVGGVSLDRVSASGNQSETLSSEAGVTLSMEHVLSEVGESEIAVELSLNYTGTNTKANRAGTTTSDRYTPTSNNGSTGAFVHPNSSLGATGEGAGRATTEGMSKFELDVDVLTLGLGMKAIYDADFFRLTAGGGPTVNLAFTQTQQSDTVTWLNDGSELYSTTGDDDESFDVLFGGYVNLAAEMVFDAQWGVGAEYRYDYTFGQAETDHVEADLDGSSGNFFLFMRY
ncbi:MAG TPA: hypothetical protein DCR55_07035 [Lentisphaeria bacterium]|nr:hypothetical protein [Lentisphaeria bacterium]